MLFMFVRMTNLIQMCHNHSLLVLLAFLLIFESLLLHHILQKLFEFFNIFLGFLF
nr:MAG TPA: hypothetical protein [Caudoviricetes sp.]